MPCIRIGNAILCVADAPVEIVDRGTTYRFELHYMLGWVAVNGDGSERRSPVPRRVWDALSAQEGSPREAWERRHPEYVAAAIAAGVGESEFVREDTDV